MSEVTQLHPDLGEAKEFEVKGEWFANIASIMTMAREGDTPQCRSLVRFFNAEHRALAGQPLSDKDREWKAFKGAWDRMVRKHGVPPLGPEERL